MDIFHVSAGAAGTVQTVARQAVRLDGRTPACIGITGAQANPLQVVSPRLPALAEVSGIHRPAVA